MLLIPKDRETTDDPLEISVFQNARDTNLYANKSYRTYVVSLKSLVEPDRCCATQPLDQNKFTFVIGLLEFRADCLRYNLSKFICISTKAFRW